MPRPIGRYDDGHWIAVAMEEIDGRCPPGPVERRARRRRHGHPRRTGCRPDAEPDLRAASRGRGPGLDLLRLAAAPGSATPRPRPLDRRPARRADRGVGRLPAPAGRRHGRPLRHPGRQPAGPPRRLHGRRRLALGADRTGLAGPLPAADQHRPVRRPRRRAARRPLPASGGPVADHRLSRRACARSSPMPVGSRVCRVCRPCGPSSRLRRTRPRPGCGGGWAAENERVGGGSTRVGRRRGRDHRAGRAEPRVPRALGSRPRRGLRDRGRPTPADHRVARPPCRRLGGAPGDHRRRPDRRPHQRQRHRAWRRSSPRTSATG